MSPVFTGDLQKQLILYPGITKGKPGWPYEMFYRHFEKSVARANALVFIGYSFRDDYINSILQENGTKAKKYVITKSNPYSLPNFMTSDNGFNHNDKGFTKSSIADCLAYLSS